MAAFDVGVQVLSYYILCAPHYYRYGHIAPLCQGVPISCGQETSSPSARRLADIALSNSKAFVWNNSLKTLPLTVFSIGRSPLLAAC